MKKQKIKAVIDSMGKKANPQFKCSGKIWKDKHRRIYVELISHDGIRKSCRFSDLKNRNPFLSCLLKKERENRIKKQVNRIGQKSNPQFCFVEIDKSHSKNIYVKIKSGNSIVSACFSKNKFKSNPFRSVQRDEEIFTKINEIGKKSNPSFICLDSNAGQDSYRMRLVKVKSGNKIKTVRAYHILSGANPFIQTTYEDADILSKINEIGKTSTPSFHCINPNAGRSKCRQRLVKIKSGNMITTCRAKSILNGANPFSTDKKRVEVLEIQPKYEKLFKKHNIPYQKEFKMGKKRIDFVFELNGKKYGLEVKQSDVFHDYSKKQISTYNQLSKLKPFGLSKVILSDPRGAHKKHGSLSIKELNHFLSKK